MKGITPERWSQIDTILDQALDLDADKREAFVRETCGDDSDLCNQVLSMLGAGEKVSDFLESPGQEGLQQALKKMAAEVDDSEDEFDPDLNTRVGPYLLIKCLGRGGMGTVYLGSRDDAAFEKFVAVKVIRRGMASDEILARFRNERRILAGLVHPNIARLLDGGATEDGRSYFVMDYVEGKTLTEFCDEKHLSIDERLELFLKVCSAVHYAHQKLIVHRDLKPGNILVTEHGDVKLLDFGIAKFLDTDDTDFTVPVTATEMRVMTPEYASPEQARGENITTASDVYQLGILLYELLTGTRPYKFSNRGRSEIEKIICEVEPERPSTAITLATDFQTETIDQGSEKNRSERLRKKLSGDLDNIVLMALRKEPDRRYRSADHLLQDIQRYKDGMPVHAQSDSVLYRAHKFVLRHRVGVIIAGLMSVTVVASLILSLRFSFITALQNEQIRIESAKKDQVKDLLLEMFNVSDPELARGKEITARDMLVPGAARAEAMLGDQPDVQSDMFNIIGWVDLQLGYLKEAEPLLKKALAMRRELFQGRDSEDLAESLYNMGRWYDENAMIDDAVDLLRQALEMRRRLYPAPNAEIADVLNDLGAAIYRKSVLEADSLWREALEMRLALEGTSSRDIAETLSNLAYAKADEGDLDVAEGLYRRALKMERELLGSDHPLVASSLHNLGTLMADRGELEEGQKMLEQAVQIRTRVFGSQSAEAARSKSYLGRVYQQKGEWVQAEKLFREVLALHIEQLGQNHYFVGRDHQILGDLLVARGKKTEGIRELRRALNIYRDTLPEDDEWLAEVRERLAEISDRG